jgi:hypothetical protein
MWPVSLLVPLFAADRVDPLMRPELVWGVLGLTSSLLAGAAVIYAVDRWRKRAAAGVTEADLADELTSFRDMYENGEITEAEYADLRRRIADKMKKAVLKPGASGGTGSPAVLTDSDSAPPPTPPSPPAGPPELPLPPPPS